MNDKKKDEFIAWLRDAHAMESQSLKLLNKLADRLENKFPALRAKIVHHQQETEQQQQILQDIINDFGGSVSTLKDFAGRISATLQTTFTAFAEDELVKDLITAYTFEQFEFICYTILLNTAKILQQHHTILRLTPLLEQERKMAEAIYKHIDEITALYLAEKINSYNE